MNYQATFEIDPTISAHYGDAIGVYFFGTADDWWRVDSISLRQWLIPEPVSAVLLGLGGVAVFRRRRA